MKIYLNSGRVKKEWTDYNGHMNLAFYIHLFDAGWEVLRKVSELELEKQKDIDKFIQENKNNFDPGNLTLINKLKK